MILSGAGWIDRAIRPLELFGVDKFIDIGNSIYLGTYPSKQRLKEYQRDLGLERVIVVLYPDMPLSRELTQMEKPILKELGIEYISIPIPYLSDAPERYEMIKDILNSNPKVTLIHAYMYDKRLERVEYILTRIMQ